MEYMEYPKDVKVESPVGTLTLAVTQADHIYVECKEATVSGKPLYFTLHWSRLNGQWTHKSRIGNSSLYAKKRNERSFPMDEATSTQKEKVIAAVTPVLTAFVQANGDTLKEAQKAHVNNALLRLEGKRQEALQAVKAIEQEMEELRATL